MTYRPAIHFLNESRDIRFLQEVWDTFQKDCLFLSRLDDSNPLLLADFLRDQSGTTTITALDDLIEKFPPHEALARSEPESLFLKPIDPIPDEEFQKQGLVLVNMRIPFSDIMSRYPNSVVAGYASSDQEQERLQQACGVDNAFFFRYGRDFEGALKYVHGSYTGNYLGLSRFTGLLTTENIDAVIAEGARNSVLGLKKFDGCHSCKDLRHYYDIQQYFLKEKKDVRALYQFSPLAQKVKDRKLPIMRKPGRCSRYHPRTQEELHRGLERCTSPSKSKPAGTKYIRQMQKLLGRT